MKYFLLVILAAISFTAQSAEIPIRRNYVTTNYFMNAPSDGWIPIWNNTAKQWSNGLNVASAANAINSMTGLGTNTTLYGNVTVVGPAFFQDVVRISNNVQITGELQLGGYVNVTDTLDLIGGKQQGSFILTNLSAMGITNIVSANANIVITTNAGVLVFTGSGGGGGSSLLTNANQFAANTTLTIKDGVLLTNATIATAIVSGSLNSQGDTTLSGSSGITANRVMYLDISKKIQTSATVTDTELGYLDNVTSSIQTQLDSKQNGSFILTNLIAMGITNITSANANIVITTNSGVLVFTGSGSGGSSGTNYDSIIVTNVIQRQVLWTTTTNLVVDWNGPDEIIWAPTGVTASLAFTGNPGNLTNAVSKILKLRLTDAGTTTITWPTNGISGLAPYALTAPSTNQFALIYDGQTFRIESYQSPSTGSGQVLVVSTNPTIHNLNVTGTLALTGSTAQSVIVLPSYQGDATAFTRATNSPASTGTTNDLQFSQSAKLGDTLTLMQNSAGNLQWTNGIVTLTVTDTNQASVNVDCSLPYNHYVITTSRTNFDVAFSNTYNVRLGRSITVEFPTNLVTTSIQVTNLNAQTVRWNRGFTTNGAPSVVKTNINNLTLMFSFPSTNHPIVDAANY